MKVDAFEKVLTAYADTLKEQNALASSEAVRKLLALFSGFNTKTVAQFVKSASQVEIQAGKTSSTTVSDSISSLEGLKNLLTVLSKKSIIDDIDRIISVLEPYREFSVGYIARELNNQIVSASKTRRKKGSAQMNNSIVKKYLKQLEEHLNDESLFSEIYEALKSDDKVTKKEAVAIANVFNGPVPASTSRPKALQRILYRHRKLMQFEAGSSSIKNQSAA